VRTELHTDVTELHTIIQCTTTTTFFFYLQQATHSTLSEPCIVTIISEKDQQMHLYLINLFQLNYPLHVLNKQVHHQEVISIFAA
jgi:adenosine/AMP kinase